MMMMAFKYNFFTDGINSCTSRVTSELDDYSEQRSFHNYYDHEQIQKNESTVYDHVTSKLEDYSEKRSVNNYY